MSQNDIIEKIKKLLTKASDSACSESESALCIAMAQKLMFKHGIEDKDLNTEEFSIIEEDLSFGTKSVSSMQAILAKDLAEHFACEVILMTKSSGQSLRIIGEKIKTEALRQTIVFAYNSFVSNWQHYRDTLKCSTQEKNVLRGSYFKGFVNGITNELIKSENENALVISKSKELNDYMTSLNLRSSRPISLRSSKDSETYAKGYESGAYSYRNKEKVIS